MLQRRVLGNISELLGNFPVVAITGPRQVGKTTLAHAVINSPGFERATYLDLESPSDRARLQDAEAYFEAHRGRLIVLDEIHRMPGIFAVLRSVVDRNRRMGYGNGQFLVLGSASLELLQQSSETLAGRIAFQELTPITVAEIEEDPRATDRLWLRGGFPDSLLARSDAVSLRWRKEFIRTYLERDVPQFGSRVPAETLRRFWTMLAHTQGDLLNSARLAGSLGVSQGTVSRYVDLLVDLLVVRRLAPWHGNVGKRLVKSPKTYVRDSGVVHALLGLKNLDNVLSHPVAGGSWEGLVIESILAHAPGVPAFFYRTAAGAEIDLVLEPASNRRYAIEIKRSTAPKVTRGFWYACEDLQVDDAIVVYPGTDRIPIGDPATALSPGAAMEWADRVAR